MRLLMSFVLTIGSLSANASDNSYCQSDSLASMEIISIPEPSARPLISFVDLTRDTIERRGCCSWHGGVCGCSNGRTKCCDGTLSPTCGCD